MILKCTCCKICFLFFICSLKEKYMKIPKAQLHQYLVTYSPSPSMSSSSPSSGISSRKSSDVESSGSEELRGAIPIN